MKVSDQSINNSGEVEEGGNLVQEAYHLPDSTTTRRTALTLGSKAYERKLGNL